MNTIINGLNINYTDEGEGQNFLILHGWGVNIEVYRSIIDHLKHKCRVIALDLPGFGKSQEPSEPWDVDMYVDFVADFCHLIKVENPTVMGHSFGGRIIIKGQASRDNYLDAKKAILVDSAGIKPKRKLKYYFKVYSYKTVKFLCKPFPKMIEKAKAKYGSADYKNASAVMKQTMVKVVNEDLKSLLPKVSVPTLLIWGENDMDTPLSDGKLMEKMIPGAGLVVLKGAGHYSFLDCKSQFCRVIDSFLGI